MRLILLSLLFLIAASASAQTLLPPLGSSRSGTSGFQYLKIPVDPRGAAMGNSVMADARDASSLYWNPALAAQMDGSEVYLSHTAYFADINMLYSAGVWRVGSRAIGLSMQFLDSGELKETTEFDPTGTGRTFRTTHLAAGLTYAQQLTRLFSYGITGKYLLENIENLTIATTVVDMGFFYKVGDTGLRFAVGITNFGFDATPTGQTARLTLGGEVIETEFEAISPPTTFSLAAAYDIWSTDSYNILLTGQLTNPSDNSERVSLGTEFRFLNVFAVRTGTEFGVDEATMPSFGAGVKLPVLHVGHVTANYGFSSRERLGALHRIGLQIGF
jgi:hypothetical protein